MRTRVVVTGMGVLSGAGNDLASFTHSIRHGMKCFSKISDPLPFYDKAPLCGTIRNFNEQTLCERHHLPRLDRFHHCALIAAEEALSHAGIASFTSQAERTSLFSKRMGVIVGTCSGPMLSIENHYKKIYENIPDSFDSFTLRYEGCAKVLAHVFGISGVSATVVTACSASLAAIGIAADILRIGMADAILVGGCDTLSPSTLAGFEGLKAISEGSCAPFSKPYGLTLGEAAAFMVIESLDHARARKATILAEIIGFGLSNDSYHCVVPDPAGSGQLLAMERSLADAGVSPGEIVYINAHGTGTEANDKTETRAIKRLFGTQADKIPVSSTKSMVGHCLGAAGCLETIATIACLHSGVYPPTANFSMPREGCTLDYIPDAERPWTVRGPVMTNSFAFGGNNASMVLDLRPKPDISPPDRSVKGPVVITACGIVSPAGIGREAFLSAVDNRADLSKTIELPCGGPLRAALVDDFDVKKMDRRIDDRLMDKSSKFTTAAASLALQETIVFNRPSKRVNLGFFLHCATGSTASEAEYLSAFIKDGFRVQQVTSFPFVVPNSITGNVCKALGLPGHNSTLCLGPGAGLFGLGFSWLAVLNGHVSAMLSGSVDELLERPLIDAAQTGMAEDSGLFPGEGACIFALETKSHALMRNAPILGEICSFAFSTDTGTYHGCDEEPDNLLDTILRAIETAGITPSNIFAVTGLSGRQRDTKAIAKALGPSNFLRIDVAPTLGIASATYPLFNLAYALLNSSFEMPASKNYFLAVFSSASGTNCAAIIRKSDKRKSESV
jgi:3-oxoacyl-[acyl-carrier-protein] synthase II